MAVTFEGVGNVFEALGGNLTLDQPGNAQQRDVIVAIIGYKGVATNFTLPTGWVLIQQQTSGDDVAAGIANGLLAYVIHTGVTPSYLFTRTGGGIAQGRTATFRGVDLAVPVDVSSSATAAAASPTVTAPTITTTVIDTMVLFCAAGADDGNSSAQANATTPLTWTERLDDLTATGTDTSISLATAPKSGASATGQFSLTHVRTARHVGIAAALRPGDVNTIPQPTLHQAVYRGLEIR